tara:strand:- start:167 stop:781 length:615 start_codon:yes stop_codon:yes gene_type:complete
MAVTLNASTSSGLVQTADTSGTVEIQSNGTTKLTVSSSGVNIGQMNGGAITAGTAVSASSTSVDFTSIPSWVKRITVMFSGVSTSGTSLPMIQLGDSGGVETTGYTAGSSLIGFGTSNYTTGFTIRTDAVASTIMDGFITINLVSSSTNSWVAGGNIYAPTPTAYMSAVSGAKSLSATLDRVRITTVNGTDTFDAGTINILYEG